MKKVSFLFIVTFLLLQFSTYSNEALQPRFRFIIDSGAAPIMYEKSVNGTANALFNSLYWGVRLGSFTLGGEVSDDYFSSNSIDQSYTAAFNLLRFTFNTYYAPVKYLELKMGIGGGWLTANLKKTSVEKGGLQAGGFSLLFDTIAKTPWPYFQLKFINRLDIFFDNQAPYYYGAFQYDFHPYFEWINLYLETGVRYWNYTDTNYQINDAIFVFKAGASFDMTFPLMEKIPPKKPAVIKEDIKKKLQLAVADITFTTDSDQIMETSYQALDEIYKILTENPLIKIELQGHTNAIGDQNNELQLSQARISRVKRYLIKKGISQERINAIGYGGTRPKYNGIDPRNRRVEVIILDDKPDSGKMKKK